MTNGKRKGSGFERELSRILTEWASGQRKEYWFYRTHGSGAIATISGVNKNLGGDIMPLHEEVHWMHKFSIEAKCGYKGASFDKHLTNTKGNAITGFWIQCLRDARKYDKHPLLVFKKDRTPTWIAISQEIYDHTHQYLDDIKMIHLKFQENEDAYIFDITQFLERVTYDILKDIACNILS